MSDFAALTGWILYPTHTLIPVRWGLHV